VEPSIMEPSPSPTTGLCQQVTNVFQTCILKAVYPVVYCAVKVAKTVVKVAQTIQKHVIKPTLRLIKRFKSRMKALFSKTDPKDPKKHHKKRKRCKYIYCRTKHGPRIITRRKPRTPFKFIVCSVTTDVGNLDAYQARTNDHSYDSDSYNIGIDDHASYCLTNSKDDFIDTPVDTKIMVKGIKGYLNSALKGTIKWSIEDDDGVVHDLIIPGSYFIEELPVRLLSPQHLAQALKSSETTPDGTLSTTFSDRVQLEWFNRQYRRTVYFNSANVAVLRSAPSFNTYKAFSAGLSLDPEPRAFVVNLNVIPNDDTDDDGAKANQDNDATKIATSDVMHPDAQDADIISGNTSQQSSPQLDPHGPSSPSSNRYQPDVVDFSDDSPRQSSSTSDKSVPNVIPYDDYEYVPDDPRQELLLWHYRLGHVPMSKLQHMAKLGDLPKRLSTCSKPQCAACRFGRATKVPWRTKGKDNQGTIKTCTKPGQCVSVDQLESTTPGLIAQLKGAPTKMRYRYVTVFIDHYSDLSYVHLQKTITSAETVEAKQAFEAYSKSLGVRLPCRQRKICR